MSPLIAGVVSQFLGKMDMLHILSVISGADSPSREEHRVLRLLHTALSNPATGDYAWTVFTDFLVEKELDGLFLAYLAQGLAAYQIQGETPELKAARAVATSLVEAILERDPPSVLLATTECPKCNFIFGVHQ